MVGAKSPALVAGKAQEFCMTNFPTPYTIAVVGAASGIGRATSSLSGARR